MSTSAPAFIPRGASEGTNQQIPKLGTDGPTWWAGVAASDTKLLVTAGGRGGAGVAQRAEPRLPEGDDFLGMTAHNPLAGDPRITAANALPDPVFATGTR